ncbi:hypothetical protein [Staphylococcus phage vB_SauH_DELF3]|nr:hypothetical protein [Staphylococcus phage vB_SauH_DELF3]
MIFFFFLIKMHAIELEEDKYYDPSLTSKVIVSETNIEEAEYVKNYYDARGNTIRIGEVKLLTSQVLNKEQKLYNLIAVVIIRRKQQYSQPIQELNRVVDELFNSGKPQIDFNTKCKFSVYSPSQNQIMVVVGLLSSTKPTDKEINSMLDDVKLKIFFSLKNCENDHILDSKEIVKMLEKLNN